MYKTHEESEFRQEYDELILDDITISSENGNVGPDMKKPQTLYGFVDVIFHPIFNTLCPYIRLFEQSGNVLNIFHTSRALKVQPKMNTSCEDHRYHEFGQLILDTHPYLGTPFLSMHVCNLNELLPKIYDNNHDLAALNWLSLVGPHIGLHMDPSLYALINAAIS